MTYVNERGQPEPPIAGDEVATLLGSLERQRATFAWKCRGLDPVGMRATVGASSITHATSAMPTSSASRWMGWSGRIHRLTPPSHDGGGFGPGKMNG
jgi:hypothetical protein